MKKCLVIACSTIMAISIIGCGSNKTVSINETTSETKAETQKSSEQEPNEKESSDEWFKGIKIYKSGQYKVGVDIPSGRYLVGNDGKNLCEVCVSTDTNCKNKIFENGFYEYSYVVVEDGEYLKMTNCSAMNENDVHSKASITYKDTIFKDAMLMVGEDINAGEYKVTANSDSKYASYAIFNNGLRSESTSAYEKISGSNYITLKEGEYVILENCKIE